MLVEVEGCHYCQNASVGYPRPLHVGESYIDIGGTVRLARRASKLCVKDRR